MRLLSRLNSAIRKQSASFSAAQATTPLHDDDPKSDWCEAWMWRSVVAHMVGDEDLLIDVREARWLLDEAASCVEVRGTFGTTWKFLDGSALFADETHDYVVAPRWTLAA